MKDKVTCGLYSGLRTRLAAVKKKARKDISGQIKAKENPNELFAR